MNKLVLSITVLIILSVIISTVYSERVYWLVDHKKYDQYLSTTITSINENTLELNVDIIASVKKNYKWHSAVCGITEQVYYMEEDTQGGFEYSTPIPLNYDRLIYYGLPDWCENGFIVFSSGSANQLPKRFRLIFSNGFNRQAIIYTGDSTNEIFTESLENPMFYDNMAEENHYAFISNNTTTMADVERIMGIYK